MLARSPPQVDSNHALTIWLCERHNEVNRRLLKPEFPCMKETLEKAWGGCGCSEGTPNDDVLGNATTTSAVTGDGAIKALRGS